MEEEVILWVGQLLSCDALGNVKPVAVRLTERFLQLKSLVNSASGSDANRNSLDECKAFWLNEVVVCDRLAFEDVRALDEAERRKRFNCCRGNKESSTVSSASPQSSSSSSPTSGSSLQSEVSKEINPQATCLRILVYATRSSNRRSVHRQVVRLLESPSDPNSIQSLNDFFSKLQSQILSRAYRLRPKPILIFLNPNSGKGKALKLFEKRVKPILDESHLPYKIFITQHSAHATEFVRETQDIDDRYSALVALSGDGLLWEILQGFALDEQSTCPVPLPIGIIPGGSGNGLAHSLNFFYYQGGKSSDSLIDATLHVVKGRTAPMDLVRYTTLGSTYLSFLSFGWGLMSDIDIESEALRFLGEARFTLWSLYRAANTKKYDGTLQYLPVDAEADQTVPPLTQPIMSQSTDNGSLSPPSSSSNRDWVTIHGPFITVYASVQPFLSKKVKFAPDSHLSDGTIWLLYIRDVGLSALKIVQFLVSLEEGTHDRLPFVAFIPVKAFRVSPQLSSSAAERDFMAIDGERIPSQTIQAEVLPGTASVLIRH